MREARQGILDYARLCGFCSQATFDIALAAGEALANAVEHGTKDLGFIDIVCRFADGELLVEVTDTGPGFDTSSISARRRDATAVRGFGISIMHAVMDGVEYVARGSTVRLRKRHAAEAADSLEASSDAV